MPVAYRAAATNTEL